MKLRGFILGALAATILSGCAARQVSNPVYWSATGTAIGAGTGALIGSIIANGDVGASALLGGGIGLGSGILIGYMIDQWEKEQKAQAVAEIRRNDEMIAQREREIQDLRGKVDEESQRGDPDVSRREWLYDGPTVGLYYR